MIHYKIGQSPFRVFALSRGYPQSYYNQRLSFVACIDLDTKKLVNWGKFQDVINTDHKSLVCALVPFIG